MRMWLVRLEMRLRFEQCVSRKTICRVSCNIKHHKSCTFADIYNWLTRRCSGEVIYSSNGEIVLPHFWDDKLQVAVSRLRPSASMWLSRFNLFDSCMRWVHVWPPRHAEIQMVMMTIIIMLNAPVVIWPLLLMQSYELKPLSRLYRRRHHRPHAAPALA